MNFRCLRTIISMNSLVMQGSLQALRAIYVVLWGPSIDRCLHNSTRFRFVNYYGKITIIPFVVFVEIESSTRRERDLVVGGGAASRACVFPTLLGLCFRRMEGKSHIPLTNDCGEAGAARAGGRPDQGQEARTTATSAEVISLILGRFSSPVGRRKCSSRY